MQKQEVQLCCACGQVKDWVVGDRSQANWGSLRTYRITHGVRIDDLQLIKTLCPECAALYQKVGASQHGSVSPNR